MKDFFDSVLSVLRTICSVIACLFLPYMFAAIGSEIFKDGLESQVSQAVGACAGLLFLIAVIMLCKVLFGK